MVQRRDMILADLKARHRIEERQAEQLRQQRERDREEGRAATERQMQAAMKAMGRKPDRGLGLSR